MRVFFFCARSSSLSVQIFVHCQAILHIFPKLLSACVVVLDNNKEENMGSSSSSVQPSKEEWNTFVIIYAVSTVVLFMKYSMSLVYASNTGNHPSEDKQFQLPPPPEDIRRRERQFANDMENIPFHMAIFWAAFNVQNYANATGNGGRDGTLALSCLFLIYTLARCLFTICYIGSYQPWRTITYMMGTLSVLTTAAFLIYSAVGLDMTKVYPGSGIA